MAISAAAERPKARSYAAAKLVHEQRALAAAAAAESESALPVITLPDNAALPGGGNVWDPRLFMVTGRKIEVCPADRVY